MSCVMKTLYSNEYKHVQVRLCGGLCVRERAPSDTRLCRSDPCQRTRLPGAGTVPVQKVGAGPVRCSLQGVAHACLPHAAGVHGDTARLLRVVSEDIRQRFLTPDSVLSVTHEAMECGDLPLVCACIAFVVHQADSIAVLAPDAIEPLALELHQVLRRTLLEA